MKTLDNVEVDGSEKEERRIAKRLARYKEREEWYETYLDDYTMIVLNEDLIRGQDSASLAASVAALGLGDDNSQDKKLPAKVLETKKIPKKEATHKENGGQNCATEPKKEILREDSTAVTCESTTSATTGGGEERDGPLFLQLQVKAQGDDQPTCRRIVDAQCGICLTNAQEGDEMVWSDLQCRHVYHRNCILPWLSSGKKRCPICQHWFVPSELVRIQKSRRDRMIAAATAPPREDCSASTTEGGSARTNTCIGVSASSSYWSTSYPFDPPGVRIHLTTISGRVRNSVRAKITSWYDHRNELQEYKLVRGERFFFYPPGEWVTRRYNSNGYSFAYASVTYKGLIFAPIEGVTVLEY